jgi:hypothetical protein
MNIEQLTQAIEALPVELQKQVADFVAFYGGNNTQ